MAAGHGRDHVFCLSGAVCGRIRKRILPAADDCTRWLLILRGISIEFRNHESSEVWTQLWDFCFSGASLLLAMIFMSAALETWCAACRIGASGYFFEPLWINWRLGAT